MRIMFVATAHNSLSQRLQVELINRGHGVAIHLATGDDVMTNAVQEHLGGHPKPAINRHLKTGN